MSASDPAPAEVQAPRNPRIFWRGLALGLLGLAVLFQLALLGRSLAHEVPRVVADLGRPALWRSAKNSQGRRFAQYVAFLNQTIPAGWRVVLPPDSAAPKALASTPFMQFFMMPRPVVNCTRLDCLQELSLENTAVLVTAGFPAAEWRTSGRLEMFDEQWGVLLPGGPIPDAPPPPQRYTQLVEVALEFLLAAGWLAALALAGFWIVRLLLPPDWGAARFALGFGLGLATLTLSLALLSLAGVALRSETMLSATLILLAATGLGSLLLPPRVNAPTRVEPRSAFALKNLRPDPWTLAFVLLALPLALLAFGKGYHASDEVALWGVKGYGIAADQAVQAVTRWGTNTLPYPLHVPLSISAANLLLGDALPAAKLVFPAYWLALAVLIHRVLKVLGLPALPAGLATLVAVTAPLVLEHAALAYANLPLGFYLFAAVALFALAWGAGRPSSASGALLLSGLMFAFAAWTRPEGLVFAWLMVAALLLAARWLRLEWPGPRQLALLTVPLLGFSLFWLWLKSAAYAQPVGRLGLAEAAAGGILSGNFHFSALIYSAGSLLGGLFDVETWGSFGLLLLAVLLALLLLALLRPRDSGDRSTSPGAGSGGLAAALMLLCGGVYLLAILAMYYLTSYDPSHDISWWVSTGLDRMVLPGLLLVWVGGIAGLFRSFAERG